MHVPEPWLSKYRGDYADGYEALKQKRAAARPRSWGWCRWRSERRARHRMLEAWDSLSKEQQALESRGMEVYAGMVDNMDHHFGRVVNFLKDIGEYDNTVILFLSDNGANPWKSDDYPGNLRKRVVRAVRQQHRQYREPDVPLRLWHGLGLCLRGPVGPVQDDSWRGWHSKPVDCFRPRRHGGSSGRCSLLT